MAKRKNNAIKDETVREENFNKEQYPEYIYSNENIKEGIVVNFGEEEYEEMKEIEEDILKRLKVATNKQLRPDCKEGTEIARLHKKWLSYIWSEYKIKYNLQIADRIIDDKNLKRYYNS